MSVNLKTYIAAVVREFSFYGFAKPPLSLSQIRECFNAPVSVDVAYSIGCDVNAGFDFQDALTANRE